MIDLGLGLYKPGSEEGTFEATWYSTRLPKEAIGTGLVKRKARHTGCIEGEYLVTYYSPDGEDAGTYDLTINRVGSIYQMFWRSQGELLFEGIGMDTDAGVLIQLGVAAILGVSQS